MTDLLRNTHRSLIAINGKDNFNFLQGLISNDIHKLNHNNCLYAAFLTAQGKYLYDFFLLYQNDTIYIDCHTQQKDSLIKRLGFYKLRSQVVIQDISNNWVIGYIYDSQSPKLFDLKDQVGYTKDIQHSIISIDPRNKKLGFRLYIPKSEYSDFISKFSLTELNDDTNYERLRINLAVPDGTKDLIPEKSTLLDYGFDHLNAIDWNKGCYIGQELTARMHYRALTKKALYTVHLKGLPPEIGTIIMHNDQEAGEMKSSIQNIGLALLRKEIIDMNIKHFIANDTTISL
ncbi:MAG: folate-binding protein [Alphaproteobacteria bacterium]|nr:folate-binding protein [Alphaproteobacteria bacterium]